MRFLAALMFLSISAASMAQTPVELSMGAPLGAAWGATYGFPPVLAAPFVDEARKLGAGFTRVTLYWSQLEPRPGVARWNDLDAYVAQLHARDEGIVTLASASQWATRTATWVFPSSPPKDMQTYYAFVRDTVLHVKGKVKYFQNDPEPNNPFFWSGTVDEFIAQQKVFYRAVKDADPNAIVILGGCDGVFDPSGQSKMPQQVASLAFFTKVIAEAAHDYDVFDLRLYDDPYTIPARVQLIRELIDRAGGHQPIVATEYAGPTFFELKANRRYFSALQGPDSAAALRELKAKVAELPIETQLFMSNAPVATRERLLALQSRDLVVRNLLAWSGGVQKTAFWDLWHDARDAESVNTMMYGTLRLLRYDEGRASGVTALGESYARMTARLGDAVRVRRLPLPDDPDVFAFVVDRARGDAIVVAWRKSVRQAEDADPRTVRLPWMGRLTHAATLRDEAVAVHVERESIELTLGSEPAFVE